MAERDPVIVGVGLSDYPKAPHLSGFEHHAQALQRALEDSGVNKAEIDGLLCAGMGGGAGEAVMLAEYLGIEHRYIDSTMTGGSAFEFHVQHAAAALRDGLCEMVLITYGSDFLSRMGRTLGTGGFGTPKRVSGGTMWEAPYGLPLVGSYAMIAQRHMFEFGTTSEQLAEIAVGVREYAGTQPFGDVPRPAHCGRCAREPHDRRPAAQTRLLRGLRRRRRRLDDDGGTGARFAATQREGARRSRCADTLEHFADG